MEVMLDGRYQSMLVDVLARQGIPVYRDLVAWLAVADLQQAVARAVSEDLSLGPPPKDCLRVCRAG
jgi:hypothetical protein